VAAVVFPILVSIYQPAKKTVDLGCEKGKQFCAIG